MKSELRLISFRLVSTSTSALLLLLALPAVAHGQAFAGTGTGAIPDGATGCATSDGSNFDVTFNVTGLTSPVSDVQIAAHMEHTWVGDLDATLIAPNGDEHLLFSRTGRTTATACGDSSNLSGEYIFRDAASGINWWAEATAAAGASILTPSDYQATAPGGAGQTNPAPITFINETFTGLPAADANGFWTLRVRDEAIGDTGAILAASLEINKDCWAHLLGPGTLLEEEDWAACGEIEVFDYLIAGPDGHMILTAAGFISLANGFTVGIDGRLTAGNDPGLDPLLVALEDSFLMGEAARSNSAESMAEAEKAQPRNLEKLREIGQLPQSN